MVEDCSVWRAARLCTRGDLHCADTVEVIVTNPSLCDRRATRHSTVVAHDQRVRGWAQCGSKTALLIIVITDALPVVVGHMTDIRARVLREQLEAALHAGHGDDGWRVVMHDGTHWAAMQVEESERWRQQQQRGHQQQAEASSSRLQRFDRLSGPSGRAS